MSWIAIDGKTFLASKRAEFTFFVSIGDGWHVSCNHVQPSTTTERMDETMAMASVEQRATKASVEAAKAEHRRLVIAQRKLPASEQWTMGSQIKHAQAVAMAEIEEYNNGLR